MLTVAAWVSAVLAMLVMIFQICLASGAPWGAYALGGQNAGVLPKRLRVVSVINAGVMAIIVFHYSVMAGAFTPFFDRPVENVINWVLAAFAAVALLMNSISRSKGERNLWAPFSAVMLVANLGVALSY